MLTLNQDPQWSFSEEDQSILCLHISSDMQYIATGISHGLISLRSPQTGRLSYSLVHSEQRFPVTSIKFCPTDPKLFISASSDGILKEWTSKNPQSIWSSTETNNQICAIDISIDGTKFFTGGSDTHLRVYDHAEHKIIHDFSRNEFDLESTRGHSNRICAIHRSPEDPNVIFTGSWDNTIQIWDTRQAFPVRVLNGAHIAGDSIDTSDKLLVAGCWRTKDQFLFWDLRTFSQLATMQWSNAAEDVPCSVYATRIHPNSNYIVGGGSGANQIRTYSMQNYLTIGSPLQKKSEILCLCLDPLADSVIFGTASGEIALHNFVSSE